MKAIVPVNISNLLGGLLIPLQNTLIYPTFVYEIAKGNAPNFFKTARENIFLPSQVFKCGLE